MVHSHYQHFVTDLLIDFVGSSSSTLFGLFLLSLDLPLFLLTSLPSLLLYSLCLLLLLCLIFVLACLLPLLLSFVRLLVLFFTLHRLPFLFLHVLALLFGFRLSRFHLALCLLLLLLLLPLSLFLLSLFSLLILKFQMMCPFLMMNVIFPILRKLLFQLPQLKNLNICFLLYTNSFPFPKGPDPAPAPRCVFESLYVSFPDQEPPYFKIRLA